MVGFAWLVGCGILLGPERTSAGVAGVVVLGRSHWPVIPDLVAAVGWLGLLVVGVGVGLRVV
jgi:hypothetical protein